MPHAEKGYFRCLASRDKRSNRGEIPRTPFSIEDPFLYALEFAQVCVGIAKIAARRALAPFSRK